MDSTRTHLRIMIKTKRGERKLQVTLYTTQHCPICMMVKDLLVQKHIKFDVIDDLGVMTSKGIKSAPMVDVDGEIMNAKEAMKWIKTI